MNENTSLQIESKRYNVMIDKRKIFLKFGTENQWTTDIYRVPELVNFTTPQSH